MKPEQITCQNCGKQIERGKWCSDKCRMAYKRTDKPEQIPEHEQPKGEQMEPEQANPNTEEDTFRASLTTTDKTFYDRALRDFGKPYYNFTAKVHEEKCLHCGKIFKTGMAMLRFCSYTHYADMKAI